MYLNDIAIFTNVVDTLLKQTADLLAARNHVMINSTYLCSVVPASYGKSTVEVGCANMVVASLMPPIPLSEEGLFDVALLVLVDDPDIFLSSSVDKGVASKRGACQNWGHNG